MVTPLRRKAKPVLQQEAINRFIYWIRERHKIYLAKEAGKPKPWTKDTVLQNYFFTNPYRENDKVTVWFRNELREPLRNDPAVLFATICFRWFNLPRTGRVISKHILHLKWNEKMAVRVIKKLNEDGPVFTGAYMIKAGNGPPGCKVPSVCKALTAVWKGREELVEHIEGCTTLEAAWKRVKLIKYIGGFMAYEIVTDLRHTYLLEDAEDIETWANPGPGCRRGLNRMLGQDLRAPMPRNWLEIMQSLLRIANRRLPKHPRLEMREIEHSLCEFDKYERARTGEGGRMKRRYQGAK